MKPLALQIVTRFPRFTVRSLVLPRLRNFKEDFPVADVMEQLNAGTVVPAVKCTLREETSPLLGVRLPLKY